MQIEHELRQRPVQTSNRTAHQRKACAGQLGSRLEIQPTVLLTQRDVVLDLELERLGRSPATHFNVLILILADRNRLVRHVRQAEHQLIQFALDVLQFGLSGFQFGPHTIDVSK